jgi:threonyl-tRNA synthetase
MRLLLLHSDFIEYTPVSKEINDAEEIISNDKVRIEDLVVTLVAVEIGDNDRVLGEAIEKIQEYLNNVKSKKVLIYPYAHLSSDLASPKEALEILRSFEKSARKSLPLVEVHRAPFGWTKAFDIRVKGHPLAENAREIRSNKIKSSIPQEPGKEGLLIPPSSESREFSTSQTDSEKAQISNALRDEERLESSWYIFDTEAQGKENELIPIAEYQFKNDQANLRKLANYELQKRRVVDEQPPHVKLMKKLGIADYESASDAGNMRFYPKGKLIKSLIEQYVTSKVIEYGAMEVETPIMYDSNHPSMASYFNRFPARQYTIQSDNRQLFLRFAACFGQFLMARDFLTSYKNLPLKLYELTRYSFRREKSGELVGLRRLRAFSMPDCHAFCRDIKQAKNEIMKRFHLSVDVINGIGISSKEDIEMAIRFTEEFYNENREFVDELISNFGRPVLVEVWKQRFFYFVLKWEFNYIDNLGKASALSTDQIDVENAKRYQIEYVDEDGGRKNPIILHNSPSGAIERVIYVLLEEASRVMKAGGVPYLPFWLSPTQVRIIPVNKDQHLDYCLKIADELSARNRIRTDVDDREESVAKRIRDAESEWIHYILVVGDNEIQHQNITVRDRQRKGEQFRMKLELFIERISTQLQGKPYIPINLPKLMSDRPQIMA